MVRLELTVRAPLPEVWRAWTTTSGMRRLDGGRRAEVDLRVGGTFRVSDPGHGADREHGRIVGYLPHELLSIEWLSEDPDRREDRASRVIVLFERRARGRVTIKLAHLRFGLDAPDDLIVRAERRWRRVFAGLQAAFASQPRGRRRVAQA